jgi:hypothetical protein
MSNGCRKRIDQKVRFETEQRQGMLCFMPVVERHLKAHSSTHHFRDTFSIIFKFFLLREAKGNMMENLRLLLFSTGTQQL